MYCYLPILSPIPNPEQYSCPLSIHHFDHKQHMYHRNVSLDWQGIFIGHYTDLVDSKAFLLVLQLAISASTHTHDQQLLAGVPWTFLYTFMLPRGWYLLDFGYQMVFPLVLSLDQDFHFAHTICQSVMSTLPETRECIHAPWRMIPNDFGYSMSFPLGPPLSQTSHLYTSSVNSRFMDI